MGSLKEGGLNNRAQQLIGYFFKNRPLAVILTKGIRGAEAKRLVKDEIQELAEDLDARRKADQFEGEGELMATAVPLGVRTDLRLRYETAAERQLYRAIRQLMRLQATRLGILPVE